MIDERGKFRTTSLFLETYYDPVISLFTYKDEDHVYQGKTFISLKKRFIEMEDPTEYEFANEYLCGWRHWQRFVENKYVRTHIDEWREELEFRLRAKATKQMHAAAASGNYQAIKWITDRGWVTRGAGRPTKAEVEREKNVAERLDNEFSADIIRLQANQGK